MADTNTLRILSLDGGGMKGYLSAKFLEMFCQEWGINSNELWKYFDIIAGTSVGGIQALGYAYGQSPTDMRNFFINDGPIIFSTSSTTPGKRADTIDKVLTMVLGGSFYDNAPLLARLTNVFGTETLEDMKTNVMIPAYKEITNTLTLFSNATFPGLSGNTNLAKDVAMATASAPLYFPEYSFGNGTYSDGGLFMNNPSEVALSFMKGIKPSANRFCVLSVGTGLGAIGFDNDSEPIPPDPPSNFFPNMYKIIDTIDVGISGPQEANALDLITRSQYTLENLFGYRFQVKFDPTIDDELDNSSSEFIGIMDSYVTDRFNADIVNINNFLGHLTL